MSLADELLDRSFGLVERLGLPIAVLAWVTVAAAVVAMAVILRRGSVAREREPGRWRSALIVGGLALAAHLADYFVTLHITPDLELEANPLWRIAVRAFGLGPAKLYALSGKVLLSVLSAQLFAWYLTVPKPQRAEGFLSASRPDFVSVARFFAFAFALFGPYFLYITAYNWLGYVESAWYERAPSPPLAIPLYFVGVALAYWRLR